jgi:hypothetical protein
MSLSHLDQLLLRGLEGRSDPNSLQYISREAAYRELWQRTGQDFGYDVEKWRDYLRQGGEGFKGLKR